MIDKLKKYCPLAIIAILLIILISTCSRISSLNRDKENLKVQLAHASINDPVAVDTIRDSIPVATASVTTVDKSTYKKQLADKQLLKDLGLKKGQIAEQSSQLRSTTDSVPFKSVLPGVFNYKDKWAEFHLNLKDSTLKYSVRDSLETIIFREYKHKFLWWKWGTKGYNVLILNYNPHTTIKYLQYIKIE